MCQNSAYTIFVIANIKIFVQKGDFPIYSAKITSNLFPVFLKHRTNQISYIYEKLVWNENKKQFRCLYIINCKIKLFIVFNLSCKTQVNVSDKG